MKTSPLKPLIVAHRGGKSGIPENSLAAFAWAIEVGAEMIEFDVRQTKDGVLVVHHDAALAEYPEQPIQSLTYEQIGHLHPLPTLQEVLQSTAGKIQLDIELKETGSEIQASQMALHYCSPEDFLITSFLDSVIAGVKREFPSIYTGLLLETNRDPWLRYQQTQADFLLPHWSLFENGCFPAQWDHPQIRYWVWTVNQREPFQQFLAHPQVVGIITDYPQLALEWRQQQQGIPLSL
ncbi:MAG: glycerophosphodiester phosphodiesterase [Cyanobacteriota bacterium]|nr:glycerophosphodiester phosphodiesterase [Cyanobacteriota bacterium]